MGDKYLGTRKKGSTMVMTTILLLIMLLVCGALMKATLNGYSMTRKYQKGVEGYYTSDKNVNKALEWVQQQLTLCENEVRNYINSHQYKNPSPYETVSITGGFKRESILSFHTAVNTRWNTEFSSIDYNNPGYKQKYAEFLKDLYIRYYFFLVNELLRNGGTDINDKLKAVMGLDPLKYPDNVVDVISGPDSMGSYASGVYRLGQIYNFGEAFDPSDPSQSSTDTKKYTRVEIKYPKGGKHEDPIVARLIVKVPEVKFVITRNRDLMQGYDIDTATIPMANAITCFKNIIVKDGANVAIRGDVFAKGQNLASGVNPANYDAIANPDVVSAIDGLLDKGGSSEFSSDDYDTDFGGMRVGTTHPQGAFPAKLEIDGSLYSDGYVHTLGGGSELSVNNYLSADATDGTEIKNKVENYKLDISNPGATEPFASYNPSGGDVFCRKLKSEESASGSKIIINGKAVLDGAVQFDGDSSSLKLNGGLYGLNSGSNSFSPDEVHSCIIQNGNACDITVRGKAFIPGVAWLDMKKLYKKANLSDNSPENINNYQTGESVITADNDTITAYTDTDGSPFNPNPVFTNYGDAFNFIDMGTDNRDKVKHFISYFSQGTRLDDIIASGKGKVKFEDVLSGYTCGSGIAAFSKQGGYEPKIIGVQGGSYDPVRVNTLGNALDEMNWSALRNSIRNEYLKKVGAAGNEYYNGLNLSADIHTLDTEDALISKGAGSPLIIERDGSTTKVRSSGSPSYHALNFDIGGVLVTDRDIIIKAGSKITGLIATSGNIIFDNRDKNGSYSSEQTTVTYDKKTVYYQEPVDGQLKAKGVLVGYDKIKNIYRDDSTKGVFYTDLIKALGGSVKDVPFTPVGEVRVEAEYRSDKMAKFSIEQWKKTS